MLINEKGVNHTGHKADYLMFLIYLTETMSMAGQFLLVMIPLKPKCRVIT